jgi:hypothetical protein
VDVVTLDRLAPGPWSLPWTGKFSGSLVFMSAPPAEHHRRTAAAGSRSAHSRDQGARWSLSMREGTAPENQCRWLLGDEAGQTMTHHLGIPGRGKGLTGQRSSS